MFLQGVALGLAIGYSLYKFLDTDSRKFEEEIYTKGFKEGYKKGYEDKNYGLKRKF